MNNTQHDNPKHEQTEPDLDEALEALQAVVMAQKAQIDALLASLEGLLTALSAPITQSAPIAPITLTTPAVPTAPTPPPMIGSTYPSTAAAGYADSGLLGNPQDPQFASLHQLMGRLKAAPPIAPP